MSRPKGSTQTAAPDLTALVFRSFLALLLVRGTWGHAGDEWFVDASIRVKGCLEHRLR